VNRSLTVVAKYRGGRVPAVVADGPFCRAAAELPGQIDAALGELDFRAAAAAIGAAVEEGNRLIESAKPWELRRAELAGDTAAATRLDELLAELVAGCRVLADEVSPFIPDGAARLAEQLSTGNAVGKAHPAFPRLEAVH
jgi:methionyl-tRNA synthetase